MIFFRRSVERNARSVQKAQLLIYYPLKVTSNVYHQMALHKLRTNLVHSTKKPVTTMLTHPWKCTVLHCNHLGNTWKPLVLMTRHFDYCPSASEGDNQSVRSLAPVVSRCFPGGYNVKLYISRGRLAWWLLAFLHSGRCWRRMTPPGRSQWDTIVFNPSSHESTIQSTNQPTSQPTKQSINEHSYLTNQSVNLSHML